jgi:hypothetical protein
MAGVCQPYQQDDIGTEVTDLQYKAVVTPKHSSVPNTHLAARLFSFVRRILTPCAFSQFFMTSYQLQADHDGPSTQLYCPYTIGPSRRTPLSALKRPLRPTLPVRRPIVCVKQPSSEQRADLPKRENPAPARRGSAPCTTRSARPVKPHPANPPCSAVHSWVAPTSHCLFHCSSSRQSHALPAHIFLQTLAQHRSDCHAAIASELGRTRRGSSSTSTPCCSGANYPLLAELRLALPPCLFWVLLLSQDSLPIPTARCMHRHLFKG